MNTQTQPAPAAVPEGYMQDSKGRLWPVDTVKEIDKLRDQVVLDIAQKAIALHNILAHFKAGVFADIAAFVETSAEQYSAKVAGDKGNVTLITFDGRYKVVRQIQESITFGEELQAAKALIDELITEWAADSRDEIKVLVNDAFQVDQQGKVSTSRVLGLRRLEIRHPKWLSAMEAISDSIRVTGSRSYVRVYERVGATNEYRPISLDLASV